MFTYFFIFFLGYSRASRSTSDRVIIFFLLLTSLFLFSTYSACILSLLQSSSSAILSIVDITKSNMEVGVQKHFPFFSVLMKVQKTFCIILKINNFIRNAYLLTKSYSQWKNKFMVIKKNMEKTIWISSLSYQCN